MTRSDLQLATDFVHRWAALTKNRRARIVNQMPVAAVQAAALDHPDLATVHVTSGSLRERCFLEHFRRALRDPVGSVREIAPHGLSCERCRSEPLCVADVVADLIDILASDPSAEVRHKTVILLSRFVGRDARAGETRFPSVYALSEFSHTQGQVRAWVGVHRRSPLP